MDTQPQDPELTEAYQDARAALVEIARKDINAFAEFVMRDERTGAPVEQANTHLKMHKACDENERLILWSHVEAGKSFQIAVTRVLFILATQPGSTVGIVSDTHEQAAKIVRLIAKYIENSAELQELAPHLKRGEPWTSHHLFIEPEPGKIAPKDPSVQACGIGGNITGSRISHMIWDDILDMENTATASYRNKVYNWLKSAECMGRLLEGAPLWCIGNAYHPDDALHRLAAEPLWTFLRLPVEDDRGRPTWPERWSSKRIAFARLDKGPLEFARQMMCVARDDSESRFKREDLDACCARGVGVPWVKDIAGLLATPWPLPPGALKAMPSAPKDPTVRGHETDPEDAALSLVTSQATGANRAHQRRQARAQELRRRRAEARAALGVEGTDPTELFPDLRNVDTAAHTDDEDTSWQDPASADAAPAWLARRRGKEQAKALITRGAGGARRGEVDPSGAKAAATGALAPSADPHPARALPHIVHTRPTTAGGRSQPTAAVLAGTTVPSGPRDPKDIAARLRAALSARDVSPEGSASPVVGEDTGTATTATPGDGEDMSPAPTVMRHAQTTDLMADDGGGGGEGSKNGTPRFGAGGVGNDLKNMPTPVGLEGPMHGGLATHPEGSPAGTVVALDSYGWLGEWLGDPGTPHRNETRWPVHPRSAAALKRMGIEVFSGVDLAVQKHSAADFTVLYTIAVYPPHGPHGHRARRVLEVRRGKWYAMDICRMIIDTHDRYDSTMYVENVAAQDYIRQMVLEGFSRPDAATWLHGYTTGKNKANPEFGIEHLAAEFSREQWIFPVAPGWTPDDREGYMSDELKQNFNEILYFDPKEHTGDVLMAMWLAKEGARLSQRSSKPAGINVRTFG